jgi:transposase
MDKEEQRMVRTHLREISDEFRALAEPLLPATRRDKARDYKRKPGGGKKAKYSDRQYFAGIVYVLRTGIIWNAFPRKKFGGLGSSALHARFQQWVKAGLFTALWRRGLAEYDELEGVAWEWQSWDGANIEAPLARKFPSRNATRISSRADGLLNASTPGSIASGSGFLASKKLATALQGCRSNSIWKGFASPSKWLRSKPRP